MKLGQEFVYTALAGLVASVAIGSCTEQDTTPRTERRYEIHQRWVEEDGDFNTAERELCVRDRNSTHNLYLITSQNGRTIFRKDSHCPRTDGRTRDYTWDYIRNFQDLERSARSSIENHFESL